MAARKRRYVLSLLLVISATVSAQDKTASHADSPRNVVASQARDLRFDVASIRPTNPPSPAGYKPGDPRLKGPSFSIGLYRELQVSLSHLVYQAFNLKYASQLDYPRWMETEYFTINATPPSGATKADVPTMLRHLLEDRFGIKYHNETRLMAGYKLIAVRPGPALRKSAGPPQTNQHSKALPLHSTKMEIHICPEMGAQAKCAAEKAANGAAGIKRWTTWRINWPCGWGHL